MIRTTPTLFIDSNIPLYAGGPAHHLKEPSQRIIRLVAANADSFLTSAEVLQEVLHQSLRRHDPNLLVFVTFVGVMSGRIEAVYSEDVQLAAQIAASQQGLEARDGVHVAVMRRLGVRHVISADRRLSQVPGIERLDPRDIDTWAARLFP
jgi:uncharacterized protein